MTEKKMTPGELTGWLDDNAVPYETDDMGRLTVKGVLGEKFRIWVRTRGYTSLPDELFHVEGNLWLGGTSITSLGNLTSVGKGVNLNRTPITSLGNLTSVGGYLDLEDTSVTSLGNLTSVGGYLDLRDTPIVSLGNLTSVGGWSSLEKTSVTSLGNLSQVGGDLYLDQNQLQLLTREMLQNVAKEIKYRGSPEDRWVKLSPSELEAIVTENETRDSLQNTRESLVDWDLYGR